MTTLDRPFRPGILALPLLALSAAASPATARDRSEPTRLDAVQVTATRVEKPIDEALASVTVIDRVDIEAEGPDAEQAVEELSGND